MRTTLLLAVVAAVALATLGSVLAQGPRPTYAEVKGMLSAIDNAPASSTLPTITIQPAVGPAVTVKVVAKTVITKAGLGKVTLDDLAIDDRATATYDPDSMEASEISVSHPVSKHHGYESTIKSIASTGLILTSFVLTPKKGGDITINVNAQTKYKVPWLEEASLSNFKTGDRVVVLAVDLKGGLTALYVHLIPSRPIHMHRVGSIETYQAARPGNPGQ